MKCFVAQQVPLAMQREVYLQKSERGHLAGMVALHEAAIVLQFLGDCPGRQKCGIALVTGVRLRDLLWRQGPHSNNIWVACISVFVAQGDTLGGAHASACIGRHNVAARGPTTLRYISLQPISNPHPHRLVLFPLLHLYPASLPGILLWYLYRPLSL